MILPWNACTISNASHSVPEPFRNTWIESWWTEYIKSFSLNHYMHVPKKKKFKFIFEIWFTDRYEKEQLLSPILLTRICFNNSCYNSFFPLSYFKFDQHLWPIQTTSKKTGNFARTIQRSDYQTVKYLVKVNRSRNFYNVLNVICEQGLPS